MKKKPYIILLLCFAFLPSCKDRNESSQVKGKKKPSRFTNEEFLFHTVTKKPAGKSVKASNLINLCWSKMSQSPKILALYRATSQTPSAVGVSFYDIGLLHQKAGYSAEEIRQYSGCRKTIYCSTDENSWYFIIKGVKIPVSSYVHLKVGLKADFKEVDISCQASEQDGAFTKLENTRVMDGADHHDISPQTRSVDGTPATEVLIMAFDDESTSDYYTYAFLNPADGCIRIFQCGYEKSFSVEADIAASLGLPTKILGSPEFKVRKTVYLPFKVNLDQICDQYVTACKGNTDNENF